VSTSDRSVLLLPGLASDHSLSMSRYARELVSAFSRLDDMTRPARLERPAQVRTLSSLVDHPLARRVDSAWSRYITYPRSLRHRNAAAFHILDHGYAQLIRHLDADRTVVTCHDLIPLLAGEGLVPIKVPATVIRTFRARITMMAQARRVLAISETTKATLERYTSVPPDRITVVPYCEFPALARRERTFARPQAGSVAHRPAGGDRRPLQKHRCRARIVREGAGSPQGRDARPRRGADVSGRCQTGGEARHPGRDPLRRQG
jgi:glycosyltransferase involved in cell wall biosynthesis